MSIFFFLLFVFGSKCAPWFELHRTALGSFNTYDELLLRKSIPVPNKEYQVVLTCQTLPDYYFIIMRAPDKVQFCLHNFMYFSHARTALIVDVYRDN
jgi:hypothetical protein